jgi:hypothetical protein
MYLRLFLSKSHNHIRSGSRPCRATAFRTCRSGAPEALAPRRSIGSTAAAARSPAPPPGELERLRCSEGRSYGTRLWSRLFDIAGRFRGECTCCRSVNLPNCREQEYLLGYGSMLRSTCPLETLRIEGGCRGKRAPYDSGLSVILVRALEYQNELDPRRLETAESLPSSSARNCRLLSK